jgi:hypothetical protein
MRGTIALRLPALTGLRSTDCHAEQTRRQTSSGSLSFVPQPELSRGAEFGKGEHDQRSHPQEIENCRC